MNDREPDLIDEIIEVAKIELPAQDPDRCSAAHPLVIGATVIDQVPENVRESRGTGKDGLFYGGSHGCSLDHCVH